MISNEWAQDANQHFREWMECAIYKLTNGQGCAGVSENKDARPLHSTADALCEKPQACAPDRRK